eukprot:CAMPEP_0175809048 /NCGR_PEP_ID=MMETSP0107_2-20121207/2585_1 /TAXON_ID=195067 ORGANISM="Goniomonas pacifica, Strain CCMP1869" /NCGR_SAMPLE_ID=MMETSP0107_2 /ASSEMBLY_ACC=CAM_ASM_000203 /LENGTH=450 /DNA_ID=CAMNT_0017120717 /DNA_START=1 /DNA_END=1353 /DNA_ORIENTATION=-
MEVSSVRHSIAPSEKPQPLSFFVRLCAYWFGYSMLWTGLLLEVLPGQVAELGGQSNKGTNLAAVVSGGAALALLNPFFGAFSDRTRSRFGRRRVWMVAGMAASLPCLFGMASAESLWVFVLTYLGFYFFVTLSSAPFNGLVADVTPPSQRGIASGVLAVSALFGNLFGAGIGFLYGLTNAFITILALAAAFAVGTLITAFGVKEPSTRDLMTKLPELEFRSLIGDMIKPMRDHDFRWVFFTRLVMEMGQYTVQEFMLYFLSGPVDLPHYLEPKNEHVTTAAGGTYPGGTPPPKDDGSAKVALAVIFIPLLIVGGTASFIAGRASDKTGRRKIFVYLACVMMGISAFSMAFIRSFYFILPAAVVFGMGYGVFYAVDYAMALDVLPNKDDEGKDIATWQLALVIPQVLATPVGGAIVAGLNYTSTAYLVLFLVDSCYFIICAVMVTQIRKVR